MTEQTRERIAQWCTEAGYRCSADGGGLRVEADGLSGRVQLPASDTEPARFVLRVPLDLPPDHLSVVCDGVTAQRSALVGVAPVGPDAPGEAEITVLVYPDGLSRHTVSSALDEWAKARRALLDDSETVAGLLELSQRFAAGTAQTGDAEPAAGARAAEPETEERAAEPADEARAGEPAILGTHGAAPAGWVPTHTVPPDGLPAWVSPDPATAPAVQLDGRLPLALARTWGGWAEVRAENGWTGWVDAARLVAL